MKIFCLLLFSILLISSLSFTQSLYKTKDTYSNSDWFWQYPKPQGNTLRDIYVFNKDTAIAVGDMGTIIKTTDGGISWDVQHHVGGISSKLFGLHFLDSQTGWAVGEALLKTTDGGKNWTKKKKDDQIDPHVVYFIDADTGFIFGVNGYLSKTTDGGNTWKTSLMDDYIGSYLDIYGFTGAAFTDKNTGWLIGDGYYGNELFKTTDCGRTWTWEYKSLTMVEYLFNDIYFIDKNHGYLAGPITFSKTTDGGTTWNTQGAIEDGSPYHSVFFTDTLTGWLTGNNREFLKTIDGGNNWTLLKDTNLAVTEVYYKVRFSDKNNGWMIGLNGILSRTTDGGNNWTQLREKEHYFNAVYFTDENNGWAVGGWMGYSESETDSGIVLHTTDGGNNWVKQITSNNLVLNSVYAFDSQNVIAVGETTNGNLTTYPVKSLIMKTSNGGKTWESQIIDTVGALKSVCFLSTTIGWAVGEKILKTSDGGMTWHVQGDFTNLNHVQFINERMGWVGIGYQSKNNVYRTTDGGNTWISQMIDTNVTLYSFCFINPQVGWAVGEYNQGKSIYKTTNGGNTWFQCNNPILGGSYNAVYFINEYIGWVVGANSSLGKIIKTTDGGNTWYEQECVTMDALSSIFVLNNNIVWVTGNGIFKTTNGGGVVSIKDITNSNSLLKEITLNQNYPNPFNPNTIISWHLKSNGHVTLKVYDILGREIATLINRDLGAGMHSINWDAARYASGVYCYRLQVQFSSGQKNGNYIETKKMVLLR